MNQEKLDQINGQLFRRIQDDLNASVVVFDHRRNTNHVVLTNPFSNTQLVVNKTTSTFPA